MVSEYLDNWIIKKTSVHKIQSKRKIKENILNFKETIELKTIEETIEWHVYTNK